MTTFARITGAIALMAPGLFAACDEGRERPIGEGVHPAGFADEESPAFHGAALRSDGYPLDECRGCHGGDFGGGDVGISCSDASCHPNGVDDCAGTCHGDTVGPLPASGRHATHIAFQPCADCHPIPTGLDVGDHLSGAVDVSLAGRAILDGRQPSFDAATRRCSDTYCHLGDSPSWDSDVALGCDGCHDHEPAHTRFARVVDAGSCGDCHAGSPAEGHIDGELVVGEPACNACHGDDASGAPPLSLAGDSAPTVPAVGAHRRHIDPLIEGRIGKVVACSRCHRVPTSVTSDDHLGEAPAEVVMALASYDPATHRCVASCHFDNAPGPLWTDDSGAERACNACHGFPPTNTRIGTRHPPSAGDLAICLECHAYAVATHVDGEVNLR